MKKITLLFTLLLSMFLLGCGGETNTAQKNTETTKPVTKEAIAENQLHEEIMAVHDEIMPWDAELNRQLRAVKTELKKTDLSKGVIKELQSKKDFLEKAHEEMMDWMAAYASPKKMRSSKSHEEIMLELLKSKKAVLKMKESYDKIIAMAEKNK